MAEEEAAAGTFRVVERNRCWKLGVVGRASEHCKS